MLKKLWCFLWGHKFIKRSIVGQQGEYNITQDRHLRCCSRCFKLNPNYAVIFWKIDSVSKSRSFLKNAFKTRPLWRKKWVNILADVLYENRVFVGESREANVKKAELVIEKLFSEDQKDE